MKMNMLNETANKVIAISEACSVVGQEVARQLAYDGALLVLAGQGDELKELVAELVWDGATVLGVVADSADRLQLDRLMLTAVSVHGHIDTFVDLSFYTRPVVDRAQHVAIPTSTASIPGPPRQAYMAKAMHEVAAAYVRARHGREGHMISVAPCGPSKACLETDDRQGPRFQHRYQAEWLASEGIRTTLIGTAVETPTSSHAAAVARAVAFVIAQSPAMHIDEIQLSPGSSPAALQVPVLARH